MGELINFLADALSKWIPEFNRRCSSGESMLDLYSCGISFITCCYTAFVPYKECDNSVCK